jgi:hypothetical protein
MNKKIETGATYELQLLNGLGYCYFKFSDFRLKDPNMLLIRVFDYVGSNSLKSLDNIVLSELLFGPNCFIGSFPRTRSKFGVKYMGKTAHPFDYFVPDFANLKTTVSLQKETDPYMIKWCPIVYFKEMPICDYNVVQHLEHYSLVSIVDIQIRASMEVCRKKKIDISKVFNLKDPIYSCHYFNILNTSEYSKIPVNKRGIAKGYEDVNRFYLP